MKSFIRQLCPPFIWHALFLLKGGKTPKYTGGHLSLKKFSGNPEKQDLDLYWDANYVDALDEWGKDNVWNEIQMFLPCAKGKVLDIACGNGVTIKILEKYKELQIHGFDISDLLIDKAVKKGIPKERLKVADATKTDYPTDEFDYSYSIGSLEHFTLEGIDQFLAECARYTKTASFHMIPISRIGVNEGWMKTKQSFFNNSDEWWVEKFKKHFTSVYSIASKWEDEISFGRWFVCIK